MGIRKQSPQFRPNALARGFRDGERTGPEQMGYKLGQCVSSPGCWRFLARD